MNRRRFTRARAGLRFTFAWGEHFELFRTVDVSAAGALLVHHVPGAAVPELGDRGECAFTIDHLEVRVEALVVRRTAEGFAVRFVGLPRALEDRVSAWVFRMQALSLVRRRGG